MSARFDQVNLSALPAPAALEAWTFDAIVAARMADFVARMTAAGIAYDTGALESDPGRILQEADAFREGLVRQRVNDAVNATSLITAVDADLDVRAAEYHVVRAPNEKDDSLRLRALLAWEALSLGGSYGGYEFFARSAAPADIADVAVYGHETAGVARGEVRIVVLGAGTQTSGLTPPSLLAAVAAKFPRGSRKVNDFVTVVAARPLAYQIAATLVVPRGADGAAVQAAQLAQVRAYVGARSVIGGQVTFGGLMGALGHADPSVVSNVEMAAPFIGALDPANPPVIGGDPFSAPICTALQIGWRPA